MWAEGRQARLVLQGNGGAAEVCESADRRADDCEDGTQSDQQRGSQAAEELARTVLGSERDASASHHDGSGYRSDQR